MSKIRTLPEEYRGEDGWPNGENLDDCTQEERDKFVHWVNEVGIKQAAELLFPGQGGIVAVRILRRYAGFRSASVALRLKGRIEAARVYEDKLDQLYVKLPHWARAW